MAQIIKTRKQRPVTYREQFGDVPAYWTTHHLDKSKVGLRIAILRVEGFPVSVRLIKGDGRGPKFAEFVRVECTEVEVHAAVEKMLRVADSIIK